jgi:DNA-directed RNA polymerase specialized sigma24 family protein
MSALPQRRKWELTEAALEALLLALDSDRSKAGDEYELLRRRLVKFFEWRSLEDPDDHADDTLNRLARNLESGEAIRDVNAYALGIARLVAHEAIRHEVRAKDALRTIAGVRRVERGAVLRAHCLRCCLAKLAAEERQLIIAYYRGEGRAKIQNRSHLASTLGIGENALRIRSCRVRAALEECTRKCIRDGSV